MRTVVRGILWHGAGLSSGVGADREGEMARALRNMAAKSLLKQCRISSNDPGCDENTYKKSRFFHLREMMFQVFFQGWVWRAS